MQKLLDQAEQSTAAAIQALDSTLSFMAASQIRIEQGEAAHWAWRTVHQ